MQPSFADISRQYPLREQLRCDGIVVKGDRFCCPFHDDKNPSANLFWSKDHGTELGHCKACDDHPFDTVEYISRRDRVSRQEAVRILTGAPPMKPRQGPPDAESCVFAPIPSTMLPIPAGKPIRYFSKSGKELTATDASYVHHYYDDKGDCQGLVVRIGNGKDKRVFQLRYDMNRNALVAAGWKKDDVPPLYNALSLRDHPTLPVLLVEGEKVVDVLKPLMPDWVITCWHGGTGQVENRDFTALNGRDVTVWPDADKPGDGQTEGGGALAMRKAMAQFQPRVLWWIEPLKEWYDIVQGFDAADLLDTQGSIQTVCDTIKDLRKPVMHESRPVQTLRYMIEDYLPNGIELVLTKKTQEPRQCEQNLWIFMRYHPMLTGRYRFDEFEQKVLVDGSEMTEAMLRDEMVRLSSDHLRQEVTSDKLAPTIWAVAHENKFNPMGNRLREMAKTWDGKARYLLDYAGVRPTVWTQTVSRRWGIGLARRIMEPGCKHDGVLVLEGPQGIGKTTFLETLGASLGPDLYTTAHTLHFKGNEAMALQGKAIVDMSELTALNKSEVEAFKAMTGAKKDNYRIPWGKRNHDFQRTCVFAGTTNKLSGYLRDPTGNRRVWPVVVEKWGDRSEFERDLPQIWAELAQRAIDKETSEMTGAEAAMQRGEAEQREAIHPWQRLIEEWIEATPGWFSYENLWSKCLEVPKERRMGGSATIVQEIMQKLGYEQKQRRTDGRTLWGWQPIL